MNAQGKKLNEISISISSKSDRLDKVLSEIEKHTGFSFGYLDEELSKKEVRVSSRPTSMQDLLTEILMWHYTMIKLTFKKGKQISLHNASFLHKVIVCLLL